MIRSFKNFNETFVAKPADRFKRAEELSLLMIPEVAPFDVVHNGFTEHIESYDMDTEHPEELCIVLFDHVDIEINYDFEKKYVKEFKFEEPGYCFKEESDLDNFLNYTTKYVCFSCFNYSVKEQETENNLENRKKVIQDASDMALHLKEFALKNGLIYSAAA